MLSDYKRISEKDPLSLVNPDNQKEYLGDELEDEIREVFTSDIAYVQIQILPSKEQSQTVIVARSQSLGEQSLSWEQHQNKKAGYAAVEPYNIEFMGTTMRLLRSVIHDKEQRPYLLLVGLSLTNARNQLLHLSLIFAFSYPLSFLVIILLSNHFTKKSFEPIRRMVASAKEISAENFSKRIDYIQSSDEIGELAKTLNDMIARLELSFNQMKQFSADAAHELKLPITKLKCNADIALRRKRSDTEYREAIVNILEDIDYLHHVTESLLLLSKIESKFYDKTKKKCSLQYSLMGAYEKILPMASDKGIQIHFENIEECVIFGNASLLQQMFLNILQNAVRYTPENGKIHIKIQNKKQEIHCKISDSGVGIPENDLTRIFNRFYRVSPSRNMHTGGSGLGLSIVHKIIEFHGGTVDVESKLGLGTTFRITFRRTLLPPSSKKPPF